MISKFRLRGVLFLEDQAISICELSRLSSSLTTLLISCENHENF